MDAKKTVFNFRGSFEKYNQVKFNHSELYKFRKTKINTFFRHFISK